MPDKAIRQRVQERADDTGSPYFATAEGHILCDCSDNRAVAEDLGGVAFVATPARKCGTGPDARRR